MAMRIIGFLFSLLTINMAVSYAMEPLTPELSNDFESKKSTVLQKMIDDCDQFIDFETDYYKTAIEYNYLEKPELLKDNIETTKGLKEKLITLKEKDKSATEELLWDLLNIRFQFLDCRKKIIDEVRRNIEKYQNQNLPDVRGVTYGPTKPEFFDNLAPQRQFLARSSTDKFQFINKLILSIWQLVDPPKLNQKTKLAIRASTTLWNNLIGQRDYLGHPDEAILEYKEEDFPYHKDWENYDLYIREQTFNINLLGWGKGRTTSVTDTPYGRSLWESTWESYGKIKELPYPDWLKSLPEKQDTLRQEEKRIEIIPLKMTENKERLPETKQASELSQPSSVSSFQKERMKNIIVSEEEEKSFVLPTSSKKEEIEEVTEEKALPQTLNVQQEIKGDSLPKTDEQEIQKKDKKEKQSNVIESTFRPRGMRLFHQNQNRNQINPTIELKGKHLKIRDKIFDPQGFTKVTFGKFKNLWQHICGTNSVIESKGSSHKKLVGPNQETFGTYAHGDGMTYSDKTIKYIRDALIQIGYGQ